MDVVQFRFLAQSDSNGTESVFLFNDESTKYTHCIMNPPYKKLSSSSRHRKVLSSIGIEVVNLYSAFVALAIQNMKEGGQLVAIIPRSFCNGVYYRPFRKFILSRAAIRQMHLFGSRTCAFQEDQVLQENVIVHLEVGGIQDDVYISTSSDSTMFDHETKQYPFEQIVIPRDADLIIHIPTTKEIDLVASSTRLYKCRASGYRCIYGPVVDFRLKEYLEMKPVDGSTPLLYPSHFIGRTIKWPDMEGKSPMHYL